MASKFVVTICHVEKLFRSCGSLIGEILVDYNDLAALANTVSCCPDEEGIATAGADGFIHSWEIT